MTDIKYYRYWVVERKVTKMMVPLTKEEIAAANGSVKTAVLFKTQAMGEAAYRYDVTEEIENWDVEGPLTEEEANDYKRSGHKWQ